MSAEPGPWRNSRTPYLVGLMDAVVERGVEQVVFLKAVQVGFSEALRNLLGFWIDHDPGPCMVVMPSQQAAEELVDERIRPLLAETPALRKHVSERREDNKLGMTRLDTMSIYTGWAGSPQALATRPIRYLLPDEVDKYPPFAGREADPISLALKRTTTYGHRARTIIGSTPTTRTGNIWKAWENCTDRRRFYVPCPHCGHMQTLEWSQVKYPQRPESVDRAAHAEEVEGQGAAYYECAECKGRIEDHHKPRMLKAGEWRSEVPGASNRRVGFHLNSLYSPWVPWSKLAGEYIRAVDDVALMMDFRNSRLAEPFEEQASKTKTDLMLQKRASAQGHGNVVPRWAGLLIATADVQQNRLYWVVRAWGWGKRSQLVAHGIAFDFDDLRRTLFEVGFRTADGVVVYPEVLGIDSRYRTNEVYEFCQQAPAQLWPVLGASSPTAPFIEHKPVKGYDVVRVSINPNHWKDVLHAHIHDADETKWALHQEAGDDYCKQLTNEHKVQDPKTKSFTWVQVTSTAPNHYWDCEAIQCAVAELRGVHELQNPAEAVAASPRAERETVNPLNAHRGRW